eukprot:c26849_g1_i4 orf=471-1547(-)
MKKKVASSYHWRWRIGLLLSVLVLMVMFLKLQTFLMLPQRSFTHWQPASLNRRIAFLFLARNRMPLDIVWERFFQSAVEVNFSVYIHSRPGFVYSKKTTKCSFFYNRQLGNSILVDWGGASMIEAEHLLLAEALRNPENERFVLLSDSCIPLYNFTYTYEYIMSSPKSFVDSFLDRKENRYNPKMDPIIQRDKWRKGSQWFSLLRRHAEVVAFDKTILPVFQKHCKRRPLPEFWWQHNTFGDPSKEHNCIPDEHYVQTLLAIHGFENETERRTLIYTLWNQSAKNRERKGWHPVTFTYSDACPKLIQDIKSIESVYYETEYRTEWCSSSGKSQPCFLFARKFTREGAVRLLNENLLGL